MVGEDQILYLFGFSPNKVMQLNSLIRIIKEQTYKIEISVVLIHDGVIGLSNKGEIPSLISNLFNLPIKIYALIPDIIARGINISDINAHVKCINYDELVDLLAKFPRIASWV
ncbi:MAG: sulfurtransferase complex subunit TusB [Candidatus Thorarchaeota archaeon]